MTAQLLVKITDSGTNIYLTVEEARELRDFLLAEGSITPVASEKQRTAKK